MAAGNHSQQTSPDEFVERLKTLITDHVAGSNLLLARFGHFVQEASKAVGGGAAGNDTQSLLSRWLDFNLASYAVLNKSSLALLNGLIGAAESTLLPQPLPLQPAAGERIEFSISGRPGEKAAKHFALENNFQSPLAIDFAVDELVPRNGRPLSGSHVTFEPPKLLIAPGGQAIVQVIVTIAPEFVVGEVYNTTIRLLGYQTKEIGLSVTIQPPKVGEETPAKAKKPSKRRRTRA